MGFAPAFPDFLRRPKKQPDSTGLPSAARQLLAGYSIEVMPKSAAAVEDFQALLPPGTRVYVAHIEGTPVDDMVATAARIREAGFPVMPHFPARIIPSEEVLETWIRRYREEANVEEALVLAGGVNHAAGRFDNSMELLETGLFERYGYRRLHVAGHPEGNTDIDPKGSIDRQDAALRWKQDYAAATDAEMAVVTQFCFEAEPVLAWMARLRETGIQLPVHVGIAGPAKLQTLLRFAAACGVGASIRVLRRRAGAAANLLRPHPPDDILSALAGSESIPRAANLAGIHVFPFGGIRATAEWARKAGEGEDTAAPSPKDPK